MRKRFRGQFYALGQIGSEYCNHERFRPLTGDGKPLWEFKEFDHRLYCFRQPTNRIPGSVTIVLFNGWIKDKKGKRDEEKREITRAMNLYKEFSQEHPGFQG